MVPFLRCSLLAVLLFASPAVATTWFIAADGSGDAPTIQAGIDLASPGDIVLVGPGTYTDPFIHLTEDISLMSRDGAAVTRLAGTNRVVITAQGLGSSALVRGFEITLPDVGGWYCTGPSRSSPSVSFNLPVMAVNASDCVITENIIRGGFYGILVDGGAPTISDNEISQTGGGVELSDSDALITGNRILDCATCIRSYYEGSPQISDNVIGGGINQPCTGISIGATAAQTPRVANNTITDIDTYAIRCDGASATIENNRITNGHTVYLYFAGNCVVRGNVLVSSGVQAEHTPATIESNTILGFLFMTQATATRNIVVGDLYSFQPSVLSCNDASRYTGAAAGSAGVNGNISADPMFCGIPGSLNFQLQSSSPCAPGNHPNGADCGLIGALPVGCGTVKTQPISWGAIKSMYRKK